MKQIILSIVGLFSIAMQAQPVINSKPTGLLTPSLNTNLTFATSAKDYRLMNFNTSFDALAKGRYTVGIGTGLDMQETDSFNISAIPLFLNFQYVFMPLDANFANIYFHFRPGISLGYSAVSISPISSTQHPTIPGVSSNSINDFVMNDMFYQTGIGYEANSGIHIELVFRNQPTNLNTPYRQRNDYLGIALGYRIK